MTTITGSQLLTRVLKNQGVEVIFAVASCEPSEPRIFDELVNQTTLTSKWSSCQCMDGRKARSAGRRAIVQMHKVERNG